MSQPPNGISINLAVFTRHTGVTDTQTDRHTDHATCDILYTCIYATIDKLTTIENVESISEWAL